MADLEGTSCFVSRARILSEMLSQVPLIAILRGIEPSEVVSVGTALLTAGFRCLEVPLNSPNALKSIESMRANFGEELFVGAGTVLRAAEVEEGHSAGAQFIVAPNS